MKDDNQYLLVLKALDIIEDGLSKNLTDKSIKERVEAETGYEKKHFNLIFMRYVKCSVSDYIRTMSLLATYRKWLKEKRELSQRDTYNGFQYFPLYFKRLFGEDLMEADEKEIFLKGKITKAELKKLKCILECFDLLQFYLLTEEGIKKMLKDQEFTQNFLCNYLTLQVEDNREEFTEKEEFGDYWFIENLELGDYSVITSNFKVEEVQFEVDEENQRITGKGLAFYDVSARTTDSYFKEDEEIRNFELGEERNSSFFYFDIHIDESNLINSHCEIEVC